MGINLKVGDKVPLFLTLESRQTNRFVRATLRNEMDVELSGSPVAMPHLSNGDYSAPMAIMMPDTDSILVKYDTFEDALFTILSDENKPTNERFDKDEITSAIDDLVNASRRGEFMAVLKKNVKVASVRDSERVAALLISEERSVEVTVEGTENVPNGATEITITMPRPMKNLNYQIKPTWKNTVDTDPIFQSFNIKKKDANLVDFTLSWNAGVDTANYQVEWQVHEVQ